MVAQAINLGTQHIPGFGWRISLACAGIPALVLTAGGLLLPDTPNSLIDRGHEDQGKQVGHSSHQRSGPLAIVMVQLAVMTVYLERLEVLL